MNEQETIQAAIAILESRLRVPEFTAGNADDVRKFLTLKLSERKAEVFAVLFLDNRHQLIEYREMFQGTIDGTAVYPREVVRAAIETNAAAVILAHNHPSGVATPSQADERITLRLRSALDLIDVRILDHFIVGGVTVTSLAERGLI